MLLSFAAKDDRVVIVEKENGGLSSARNAGLEKARGEWVVFPDPDDRVESCYLERLLSAVDGTNNVLGVGGFHQYYEAQGKTVSYLLQKTDTHVLLKDCLPNWSDYVIGLIWNKIYKTEFLRNYGLKFETVWREDLYFMLDLYPYVEHLGVVEDCGYKYLMHGNTLSTRYHDNAKALLFEMEEKKFSLLKKCGVSEHLIKSKRDSLVAFDIYQITLNIFNRTTPLSFHEKVRYVREEIMNDKKLMERLEKHNISNDKKIVKLTARLMLTYKAWIVAWVFRILFALKNNFKSLYFWYDAHFSGKFSS